MLMGLIKTTFFPNRVEIWTGTQKRLLIHSYFETSIDSSFITAKTGSLKSDLHEKDSLAKYAFQTI